MMALHVTERNVVRRHAGPGGWRVTLVERPDGLANVSTIRGVTRVFVADCPAPDATQSSCFAAAECTPEGDALVLSHQAPPALLISDHGHRRAPSVPGVDELIRIEPDEVLLLLSSAVFEDMPQLLARVLHGHAEELLAADPGMFLTEIFDETGSGAGAMISHMPTFTHLNGGQE
jgi:hypothetical protein